MIDSGPRPYGRGPVVFATSRRRASVTFRDGHGSALHRSNFSLVIRRALWKPDDVGAIGPGELPRVEVAPASAVSILFVVRTTAASFGRGSRHGSVLIRDDGGAEQMEPLSIAGPFNATGPINSGEDR